MTPSTAIRWWSIWMAILAAPVSSLACVAPTPHLVSWWPADGDDNDIANRNPGMLLGGMAFAVGEAGQGFLFDSDDDGVIITHSPNLEIQSSGFTAEFWMQGIKNQPNATCGVVDKSHGFLGGWSFSCDSISGAIRFHVSDGISVTTVTSLVDVLDGTFHHVAGTWDGGAMRLYVDGVLQPGSTPLPSPAPSMLALYIGQQPTGGGPERAFRGVVDELAIYDRAFSAGDIQAIVAAGSAGKCHDLGPCGDGHLNVGEQCDDGNVANGDCCASSCQFDALATPCTDDGNVCTADVCDLDGICTHPNNQTVPSCDPLTCAAPPADLIGWWPGDGSVGDIIGGNPGTLQGGAFFTLAEVAQGFTFDSNDDGVIIPHSSSLNLAAPGFTAEFWMRGIKNQPYALAAMVDKSHGSFTGWVFQCDTVGGNVSFTIGSGGGFETATTAIDVLDGNFHHIAGTWDGSTMQVYVDGVLQGTGGPAASPNHNTGPLNVGFASPATNPPRHFRGRVDEVSIYRRALGASEIAAIHTAGSAGKCSMASISGKALVLRERPADAAKSRVSTRSKDPTLSLGAGNMTADDPVLNGGSVRIVSTAGDMFDDTYPLPAANWRYLGRIGQNRGYRYVDRLLAAGPIQRLVIRPGKVLRVVGKGAGLGHSLGADPNPVRFIVRIAGRTYCMSFGGTTRFTAGRTYRAKDAPAAAVCPP